MFCPVLEFREEKRIFTKVEEVTWTFSVCFIVDEINIFERAYFQM